jgi:hypothetical protein
MHLLPAPFFVDDPKIVSVTNDDNIRHFKKQPGSYDARNRPNFSFQPGRISNRGDLSVENVVTVVGHK